KINLLPWRAELRKQRQKEFNTLLGGAGVLGALLGFLIVMYYNGQIEGQENRNNYLRQEIAAVEIKLQEIEALDRKRAGLIKRKEVIEELQSSRSQMVHLFDELVRTIPEGVKLTSIKQAGVVLTLEGRAQSNARVATYMRNLDASGWMAGPDVSVIEARGADSQLPFAFSLRVNLKTPQKQADVEAGGSL
ncbi:MAG TPA: PilN domain-containing protein, partial [Arenimonas sp.]|nr:PilN domain-containing protein [Arenimonas sp.]